MHGNLYAIDLLAKERQHQLREEAARDRLARQAIGQSNGPVGKNLRIPRPAVGLGSLFARVRVRFGGTPLTREPAG